MQDLNFGTEPFSGLPQMILSAEAGALLESIQGQALDVKQQTQTLGTKQEFADVELAWWGLLFFLNLLSSSNRNSAKRMTVCQQKTTSLVAKKVTSE